MLARHQDHERAGQAHDAEGALERKLRRIRRGRGEARGPHLRPVLREGLPEGARAVQEIRGEGLLDADD